MLKQSAMSMVAITVVASAALGFAWAFCRWWALGGQDAKAVFLIYAAAAAIAVMLFLVGRIFAVSSHAYYLAAGGAVFLAVDLLVWQRFGTLPSVKFLRGGMPPAAILGLFAGALYRIVAIATPVLPRDPPA